jgi:hypothetical protein
MISRPILLRMGNVSHEVVEKIKTHCMFNNIFVLYNIEMFNNIFVLYDIAHAHCMLDTWRYNHKLGICITYCSSNGYTNALPCYVMLCVFCLFCSYFTALDVHYLQTQSYSCKGKSQNTAIRSPCISLHKETESYKNIFKVLRMAVTYFGILKNPH